ncbi:MAG: NAD-dependent epimerase/dehydratase family protein [Planctomycetia bacterium]|nr:NAD-dependent epimerase/dehydratase family protein [Planctomycetia bacterium]
MHTAFVTGATGFIGRHLVDGLLDRGCEVRCLVRDPSRAEHLRRDGVQLVNGSLANVGAWQGELAGCDVVFNAGGLCMARSRDELFAINERAVGDLADACAALETPPPLVHVSSLAAAGPSPNGNTVRDERDGLAPVSAYGASKLAGDVTLRRRATQLPITAVQPGIVFGPHDTKMLPLYQMINTTRLHLPMGLRPVPLSLIHIDDLVSLLLSAADRGERMRPVNGCPHEPSGIYHACDDREHPTYEELGRRVARAIGRGVAVIRLPAALALPFVAAIEGCWNLLGQATLISRDKLREATARSWAASAAKARDQLGFAAAAPIDDRLRETGDWFRSNRLL